MKELESLKSIFKDRIFKIPDYQRGYAWSIDQLKDFWEDLLSLGSEKNHYTGVLTIKEIDKISTKLYHNEKWLIEDRGYKAFHVVDGQQRLTTFVIFIQSIYDLLKKLPENKEKKDEEIYLGSFNLKQIKEEYLVIQKPPQFIINTYKFSYEVDNPSFNYLRYKIFKESSGGELNETFYTLNLENAKIFFDTNLENYYENKGLYEIESIFKKLTQNLMFNLYEINNDFDVYVAFETMNNRGKKLSNLELLKNRLIYLSTLYEEKELKYDEKEVLREKINDSWKEVYYQLGKNKRSPLHDDEFLTAHWIMYFKYKRVTGNEYVKFLLYQHFIPQNILKKIEVNIDSIEKIEDISENIDEDIEENNIENGTIFKSKISPKEIEKYVLNLKTSAGHWYNSWNPLNNPKLTQEESIWIDKLNRIGMVYFRPLITASFMNKKVTSGQRVELFKEIERFIFIIFRLNRFFSTYRNSEFFGYARQLLNDEISIDYIITKLQENLDEWFLVNETNNQKYLNEKHFKNYLERLFKNNKGYYSWNGLRYFLYEYEIEKVQERGNQKIDWKLFVKNEKDKVSIEHIFPQTPKESDWTSFFKYKENDFKYFQGTLGNLLPLSQSINSSLQNDSFQNKKQPKLDDKGNKIREGYNNGSHSEIEVSSFEFWTPETILERGLSLIKFMEKRWNFKFQDESIRKDLLLLSFLENEQ